MGRPDGGMCRSSSLDATVRGDTFGDMGVVGAADGCPGCGGLFPLSDGPAHPYMTASPGCWQAFTAVLAADYAAPERMSFHQLVVDAYAAQHPGGDAPKQV